ncbi:GNAT family N-acetyltransferase [Kaistella antarctica]|uniref:Ribosomal-protein-alanine acetyltransferase n=1 Tax=Kaistella antarctica TaxID=266748 RepID=A0A448NR86_9FLAO|nr:GNAT family N-acetyltransferase [Kaistella antarctica]KEY18936.1 hypothetical protein HY04_10780 [Kaistella antarctica]SEW13641.1 Acetyltransferase (GNAT) domain-containing protein [Kaistella antarctica]VEH99208.1 ribosomal-protein-alanine acetyltransferase [Kaistella antarctica]
MVDFKKAIETDIPLLRELAQKSWKSAYANILSPEQIDYMLAEMYSEKEISSQLQNSDYHYYLILSNEIPAGFMGFELNYEKDTTKLHRIYLLEEFKGKGLGKKGLIFLKEKVKENVNHRIILNVNKNNPAIKIYESQGFKVFSEGIFDIGNDYVMDDFLMEFNF